MKEILVYKDYLPEGLTFEKLAMLADKNCKELTLENLKQIISEEALNMSEEDLEKFFKDHNIENIPLNLLNKNVGNRNFAYAEDLEKPEHLNQDFPEVEDEDEEN